MDPVTLIVTALVAGAAAGGKDAANAAIKDAYEGLKALLKRRFAGRPAGEVALAQHASKPEHWGPALKAELIESDAPTDTAVVAAAKKVLELVDPQGSQSGKYLVDLRGSQGVQIGDRNTQTNTFTSPPSA